MSFGLNSLGNAIEDNFSPAGKGRRANIKAQERFQNLLTDTSQDIINRATQIADRPYEEYTGDRVANLSANEQQALNLAQQTGQSKEYLQKSGNLVDQVANNDFSGEAVSKYMNPYVSNVVDNQIKNINEQSAQNLAAIRGQSASRGAFGGARQSLAEQGAEKSRLSAVDTATAQGYSQAYDNAIQTWASDNQRKLSAAQAYASVGNDITKMNSQQIQDLMATGGADRALNQMKLDVDYSAFIEERDWSANNLQTLITALGAARGGNAINYGSQSNTTGQLIGAVSAIAGFFNNNNSGSTDTSGNAANYDFSGSGSNYGSNLGSGLDFSYTAGD